MRLLIADDERDFLGTVASAMRAEGYAVDEAEDGEEALFKAENAEYDTLILDVMLPRLDGLHVVRRLRRTRLTPVLMLTARTGTEDRILGLDSGADDYLPKPVDLRELAARVRALIRRSSGAPRAVIA